MRAIRFVIVVFLLFALVACGRSEPEVTDPSPLEEPASREVTPVSVAGVPGAPEPMARPTRLPTPAIVLPAPLYLLSNGQIQRLETDGLTLTQLTLEEDPITDYDVSPIDARLIYVSGNKLIEANPQYGTRIVKVAGQSIDPNNPIDYMTARISDPRFGPDGRQIAFGLNGVNLIGAGEVTTYTTILASDPYPDPNNPLRSDVRFFVPGAWSPAGENLMVRFSYWPEASGLGILDLATQNLALLASDDPNLAVCCDWAWGRDGASAFVASDIITYGSPGLSRVDVESGEVTTIIQGMPLGEISAENPLHLFRSPHQMSQTALYTFASLQSSIEEPVRYVLSRVVLESGDLTALRHDAYETSGDILWAGDGSGAALVLVTMPGPLGGWDGPLVWVPADGAPALELPAVGEKLRWGPSVFSPLATEPAAERAENDEQTLETTDVIEEALVTARLHLNVRSGPSTAYAIVGELAEGETAVITGVAPAGDWWQIVYPPDSDERAWVIGDPDLTSAQRADDVAVAVPPPLPRPVGRIYFSAPGPNAVISILAQSLAPGATPEVILQNASQPSLYRSSTRLALRSSRSDLLGIGVFDLENRQIDDVTSHPEDSLPTWSPRGDRLVFASTRHGDRRWRIYTAPASGNQTAQDLTFGLDPDWHPSADRIVYKGCDDSGERCGLWLMDSSGGNRAPLTADRTDSRPRWSPDGRTIVFMSEARHGNWEIYSVDASGNVVTRLTDDPALDGLPTVSPDGSRVAFVSNRGGEWGIWVMPITGGNPQQVIDIGAHLPNWLEQGIDWAE